MATRRPRSHSQTASACLRPETHGLSPTLPPFILPVPAWVPPWAQLPALCATVLPSNPPRGQNPALTNRIRSPRRLAPPARPGLHLLLLSLSFYQLCQGPFSSFGLCEQLYNIDMSWCEWRYVNSPNNCIQKLHNILCSSVKSLYLLWWDKEIGSSYSPFNPSPQSWCVWHCHLLLSPVTLIFTPLTSSSPATEVLPPLEACLEKSGLPAQLSHLKLSRSQSSSTPSTPEMRVHRQLSLR